MQINNGSQEFEYGHKLPDGTLSSVKRGCEIAQMAKYTFQLPNLNHSEFADEFHEEFASDCQVNFIHFSFII